MRKVRSSSMCQGALFCLWFLLLVPSLVTASSSVGSTETTNHIADLRIESVSTKQTYKLESLVLDAFGTRGSGGTSSSYRLTVAGGQPAIGNGTGTTTKAYFGFLHPDRSVGVHEKHLSDVPVSFAVSQNCPNPVVSGTYIEYALPKAADVKLAVYDMTGRDIRTLSLGNRSPGRHRVHWDGTDDSKQRMASGIYFYRLQAGDFKATRKLTILR